MMKDVEMNNKANQCPKCSNYIIGEYCFTCQIDIRNYLTNDIPDVLKDIFKENDE